MNRIIPSFNLQLRHIPRQAVVIINEISVPYYVGFRRNWVQSGWGKAIAPFSKVKVLVC